MSLVSVLVALILIGLLFWGVRVISAALAIPPPIVAIVHVVLVILIAIWLLQSLGGGGLPTLRLQ